MTLIAQLILLALGVAALLWAAKRDTFYSSEAAEHGPSPPCDMHGLVHLAESDGHPLIGDRESACDQSMARTGPNDCVFETCSGSVFPPEDVSVMIL